MATTTNWVWTFDPNTKPSIANPPAGWEQKLVPSGSVIRWLPSEVYLPNDDTFIWYKAYFFLPAQKFKITELCDDNTWMDTGARFDGPVGYKIINLPDGQGITQRIEAV